MISNFKQLEKLFYEIDKQLKTEVTIYVIGGAVLLYHGLKPATKDIDVITADDHDYVTFENALTSINFKAKNPTGIYKKLNLGAILERDDYRIDVFNKTVCKMLALSEGMKKRAKEIINYNNLKVYLCSNEDIFIFKSVTEREGDLEDNISLVQHGINWKIVFEEIILQIKTSGQDVWITWIGERFDNLEEKGINIPIMKDINKLRDEYFNRLEQKNQK